METWKVCQVSRLIPVTLWALFKEKWGGSDLHPRLSWVKVLWKLGLPKRILGEPGGPASPPQVVTPLYVSQWAIRSRILLPCRGYYHLTCLYPVSLDGEFGQSERVLEQPNTAVRPATWGGAGTALHQRDRHLRGHPARRQIQWAEQNRPTEPSDAKYSF